MKYFLTDVKKLYRNKLFLLALAILLVAAVIDPITMRSSFEQQGNPFMWWMFMSRTTGSTIYNTLEWFFPVLLTGLLFVDESKTAIYGILITKKKRGVYFLSKALSVFIVTFFSLLCLFLLNLLLVYIVCPSNMEIRDFFIPKAGTLAAYFYEKSPLCEAIFYIVLHALAMALLSVFYLTIHMIVKPKNKYLAFVLPPLIMYVLNYITDRVSEEYGLSYILQPVVAAGGTSSIIGINHFMITFGTLFLIDIICLFIGVERNRDVV